MMFLQKVMYVFREFFLQRDHINSSQILILTRGNWNIGQLWSYLCDIYLK